MIKLCDLLDVMDVQDTICLLEVGSIIEGNKRLLKAKVETIVYEKNENFNRIIEEYKNAKVLLIEQVFEGTNIYIKKKGVF